ncbi:oocyte zinc finger protein XlCOF6-like [Lineus longissimus]|uniref:oocyte zinc finger protein XlCOF6-like n=1 Tax=Lineus longissimus TaxID=88925 RepID=UPI00315D9C59
MSQAEVDLRARTDMTRNQWSNVPGPDVGQNTAVSVSQASHVQAQHQNEMSASATPSVQGLEQVALTSPTGNPGTSTSSDEAPPQAQSVIYQCQHCSLMFVTEAEIRVHLQSHLAPKTLKETDQRQLTKHPHVKKNKQIDKEKQAHVFLTMNPLKKFECRYCLESFQDLEDLESHKLIHMTDEFECLTCGKFFSAKTALTLHERVHTGERPFACKKCGKAFAQHQHLVYHEMSHTGEKPHSCLVCDKRFVHQAALNMHMRTHTGEKPYACDLCGKRFKQRQHLLYHGQTHMTTKNFHCDECGKDFSHASSLKTHQKIHAGVRPFECSICNKKFIQKQHMLYHMGIHTGEKQFKCNLCEKSFVHNAALKAHMRNNHSDSFTDFTCDICQRECANLSSLQSHFRLHSGERPFSCSLCEKSFTQKQHLEYHMVTHTGLKKIQCRLCQKRFIHKSAFKTHNNNKHDGEGTFSVDCLKCGLAFDDEIMLKTHPCRKFDEEEHNASETVISNLASSGPEDSEPASSLSLNTSSQSGESHSEGAPQPCGIMETDASLCSECGKFEKDHVGSHVCVNFCKIKEITKCKNPEPTESEATSNKTEQTPVKSVRIQEPENLDRKSGKSVKKLGKSSTKAIKSPCESASTKRSLGKSGEVPPPKVKKSRKSSKPKQVVPTCTTSANVCAADSAMSYKCLDCGSTFVDVSDLITHVHSHAKKPQEPAPPKKSAVDSEIDDKSSDSNSMDRTGEFECPECEEKFSRMSVLHAHLRKHSVEQPLLAS